MYFQIVTRTVQILVYCTWEADEGRNKRPILSRDGVDAATFLSHNCESGERPSEKQTFAQNSHGEDISNDYKNVAVKQGPRKNYRFPSPFWGGGEGSGTHPFSLRLRIWVRKRHSHQFSRIRIFRRYMQSFNWLHLSIYQLVLYFIIFAVNFSIRPKDFLDRCDEWMVPKIYL